MVRLTIEDRGPGLPPEVRASYDQRSRAPSRAGSAGEQGHGYGLMLARDYLEAMGGRLELSPREGGGVAASVWLNAA